MNTIKKALKRTAYEFDVPLSEVQGEIQDIIDECYNSTDKEYMTDGVRFAPTVKSQLLSS